MKHAKFAALSRVLIDLGFTMRTDSKFIRFDNAKSNTWFLYPAYSDEEEVMDFELTATRYILDYKGIMSREQFEDRLKSISVAS